MQELTEIQKELCKILHPRLDDEAYICTMLFLVVKQEYPDENCKKMIEFLQANPQADKDEIMEELSRILGIDDEL